MIKEHTGIQLRCRHCIFAMNGNIGLVSMGSSPGCVLGCMEMRKGTVTPNQVN